MDIGSLFRWWSGTADQVVVVNVDDFFGLIGVREGNGPVGADCFVVVHGALIVTVVLTGRADHWKEAAFTDSVDDGFNNHAYVVACCFRQEPDTAACFVWQGANDFVGAGRIKAEQGSVFAFHRVQNRDLGVAFFFPIGVLNQL